MLKLICYAVGFATTLAMIGCSSTRVDMVETGRLRVETLELGSLGQPRIWLSGGELTVYGSSVRRAAPYHEPPCVNVTVVAPDGITVARQEAVVSYSHAGSSPNRVHLASYSARFPIVPPDGSIVRVRPCSQPHANAASR